VFLQHIIRLLKWQKPTSICRQKLAFMNAGVGFPLGDFGDNAPSNSESGFAKIGYIGKMDIGIKVYRSIGLCLSAVGGVNKADESALELMLPTYPGVNKEVNTQAGNILEAWEEYI
jgi:hypothetical protein